MTDEKHEIDLSDTEITKEEEESAAPISDEAKKDSKDAMIQELKNEVEKYKKLAEENFKQFQYARADLENLKKRALQDRNEMRRYGIIPFAKDILHVVDNLDRALEHLEASDKESLTKGIQMTIDEFEKVLGHFGIVRVPTVGKFFDANVHEGLLTVETNAYSPNTVIEELQKGYMLDDRLLRAAKVSVSAAKKGVSDEEPLEEITEEDSSKKSSDIIENDD